nr:zinc finger protein 575 [Chrysemys picta bellii]
MMSETHKHTDVGGSEDVIFEEEDGTSTGVSTVQEEEDESEATSVSSGESRPSTPSANGYPGPRSKELRSAVSEPQQEVVAEEGDAGQGRLGSPQAPSPEWHECPECGRGFGTSRALKVHRSYHVGRKRPHTSSSSKPPPPRPAPPSAGDPEGRDTRPVPPSPRAGAFHYICAECGLGFASPASLEAHRCEHGWRRSPPARPAIRGPPPHPARPMAPGTPREQTDLTTVPSARASSAWWRICMSTTCCMPEGSCSPLPCYGAGGWGRWE